MSILDERWLSRRGGHFHLPTIVLAHSSTTYRFPGHEGESTCPNEKTPSSVQPSRMHRFIVATLTMGQSYGRGLGQMNLMVSGYYTTMKMERCVLRLLDTFVSPKHFIIGNAWCTLHNFQNPNIAEPLTLNDHLSCSIFVLPTQCCAH